MQVSKSCKRHPKMIVGGFVYSSYWRTWSKVLKIEGWDVVELNLTGPDPGKIRKHCTPLHRGDRVEKDLPSDVCDQLIADLGKDRAVTLINYPIMDRSTSSHC